MIGAATSQRQLVIWPGMLGTREGGDTSVLAEPQAKKARVKRRGKGFPSSLWFINRKLMHAGCRHGVGIADSQRFACHCR